MSTIIESIRSEYVRYKILAERAIEQLDEEELSAQGPNAENSIAILCWHISGNLRSRFTDFLTSDGEKPWRQREEEFRNRAVTRPELMTKWEEGWSALLGALGTLTDDQLHATVTIRQEEMHVHEALHRSLAHTAYHVGQIVFVAKAVRGKGWKFLSIPPGQSDAFNQQFAARQSSRTSSDTPRR